MQRRTVLIATFAAALLTGKAPAQTTPAQTTPARIRGTIRSLEDHTLTVETRGGDTVRIALAPNYTVGAIVPTTLDAVKPGAMIGIVGFGPPSSNGPPWSPSFRRAPTSTRRSSPGTVSPTA